MSGKRKPGTNVNIEDKEETAGLKGFEPLTYGLRVERNDALQSIAAQSQVLSVMFTEEDVANYRRYNTKGLTVSSSNWINKILNQMAEVTKGELSLDSLNRQIIIYLPLS